jgi:hypothetical protein
MTDQPTDDDLLAIVDSVTEAYLHEHAIPAPRVAIGAAEGDELWTGCITLAGAFNGAITLTCTRGFARRAAGAVFKDEELGDDEARDVLGELTSVMGGNIKSLYAMMIDSHCRQSPPIVSVGTPRIPGTVLLKELWWECKADRFQVSIFQEKSGRATPPS